MLNRSSSIRNELWAYYIPLGISPQAVPKLCTNVVIGSSIAIGLGLYQTIQPRLLATEELIKLDKAPESTKASSLISLKPYDCAYLQCYMTNGAFSAAPKLQVPFTQWYGQFFSAGTALPPFNQFWTIPLKVSYLTEMLLY